MKTDLFFPRKAYITVLSIMLSLTLVGDMLGQCYFLDCPSPPVVTVLDNDVSIAGNLMDDCMAPHVPTFTFDGCAPTGGPYPATAGSLNVIITDNNGSTVYVSMAVDIDETSLGVFEISTSTPIPSLSYALGSYHVEAEVVGATDPAGLCEYDFVVQETYSLACNDDINISLDANCQATILVDMILEGEVFCYDDYTIEVDGFPSAVGQVVVDAPGMYGVTITSPSGQSCWSEIEVEDKLSQPLFCDDVITTCAQDNSPGAPIRDFKMVAVTNAGTVADVDIDDMGTVNTADDVLVYDTLAIPVDFSACPFTDTVLELEVELDFSIPRANQTKVLMVCPNAMPTAADTITLLDMSISTCVRSDFFIQLADDAILPNSALSLTTYCGTGIGGEAFTGQFTPVDALSAFTGKQIQGVWQILVVNTDDMDGNDITVDEVKISATVASGSLTFPIAGSDVNWVPTGPNTYDVIITNNNCGPYTASYVDVPGDMCSFPPSGPGDPGLPGIVREWTLENGAGLSATCEQNIFFETPDIIPPPHYDGLFPAPLSEIHYPAFQCGELVDAQGNFKPGYIDANGNIDPHISGFPHTIYGDEIDFCQRFQVTYTDLKLPICGNAYKIIRDWTIYDWCAGLDVINDPYAVSGSIWEFTQLIKVIDIEAPVMVCAPDQDGVDGYDMEDGSYVAMADPYNCEADWTVIPPYAVYDCGAAIPNFTFNVEYLLADDDGLAPDDGDYISTNVFDTNGDGNPDVIRDLPVGRTWIRYSVADDCGNIGYCFTEVTIVDEADPFAVCIEYTVAALSEQCLAVVHAKSFDNGSWDNCSDVTFEARLCDEHGETDNDFRTDLQFDGNNINCGEVYCVKLKVTDSAGNTSSCWVELEIQDHLPPVVTSRPQDTVLTCDQSPVTPQMWRDWFMGQWDIYDNCDNVGVELIDFPDPAEPGQCGEGTFIYKWRVFDSCGNEEIYDQRLTFVNNAVPFVSQWPTDRELTECSTIPTPGELGPGDGYPTILNDVCSQLAVDWDDEVFEQVDDYCIKIFRKWTVIDWCEYDPNDPSTGGISTHTQVIKIDDVDAPVIDCPNSFTIESVSNTCNQFTDEDGLRLMATDACSDAIDYDLIYEWTVTTPSGAMIDGTGTDANGLYEFGLHSITWKVTDHCDNMSTCTYTFDIRDVKSPTPYCLGTVVTATMNVDGSSIGIWASDYDLGGTDNYTGRCNTNTLDVYFIDSLGNEVPSLDFDCDDIPNGISATFFLKVYYRDEYGNTDFCEVTLVVQDNQSDICPDVVGSRVQIDGRVRTEDNQMVENVTVEIDNGQPEYPEVMVTQADGKYYFDNMPMNNNWSIISERNGDLLNGVSTLDIVLIQKHILGLLPLNSPYKIIAADVNNNGSVSGIDLVELRKAILGITTQFPNNQDSWRFVDAGQTFNSPTNPFPFSEILQFNNMSSDVFGKDIVGVKIGDVNNNVIVNLLTGQSVDTRNQAMIFEMEESLLTAGTTVSVPVYAANFDNIHGYQFTLNMTNGAQVNGITAGLLDIDETNIGVNDSGVMTTSWHSDSAIEVSENDILFTIELEVSNDMMLSEALEITSDITIAEAYDADLNVNSVKVEFRNGDTADIEEAFELYQNVPNPFEDATEISFSLPVKSDVRLSIFDLSGKTIKTMNGTYEEGVHSIRLFSNDLENAQGVLYYRIETDGFVQTKKMIRLK